VYKRQADVEQFRGGYTPERAAALKAYQFDRQALGERGLGYEKLDQLTFELLMGAR